MSAKIRRGGKGVRRAAAAKGAARKVATAKRRTGSAMDGVLRWVPVSEETLHRIALSAVLGGAAALVFLVASFAGVPAMAERQLAMIAADAGFEVKRVEVRGVERMNELKVYEKVLAERNRAMPLVDIDGLREKLVALSWIKDARISRQLPDTLVIDVVERVPHAVLRKADRLVLIDAVGEVLEPVSAKRAKGMLEVSGMGAGKRVAELGRLLDAAPALKPQVTGAEWVGNRRWNITFKTGQVLALPQGEEKSASALLAFARMDGVNRLLGGQVAAFDMRAPDRIYLRVPGRAEQAAAAAAKAKE